MFKKIILIFVGLCTLSVSVPLGKELSLKKNYSQVCNSIFGIDGVQKF